MPAATPASAPVASLLQLLEGSLPMYLSDSGIWSYPGPEEIKLALADVVADQKSMVERAGGILEARSIPLPARMYPLSYASLHDVDLRFLLPRLVDGLRRQVVAIDSLAATVVGDPDAAALVHDARAATAGHVDALAAIAGRAAHRPQAG